MNINNDLTADLMYANAEISQLRSRIKQLEIELESANKQIKWYNSAIEKFQEIGLTPAEIIEMRGTLEGVKK